ncbi:two-component system, chemotaxis family, sensor kinase CheA [Thermosulfidibacter takaii ABI70S6]|uniref:histidine kinase n=1 Tax=Thermosulfidibacter takaii (strain DSM 17441 / JCM 13301 / NBRC 103674 / ABI70S6) TaxID=1298851 RepID=A0A0S3QTF5_THET7|nr:chemotaxis protein CheA [Thermosulfidibacter takaii]BAT71625.1 two-component system, chemotaxis family, sensor kinase CheA [Thermosulfidibacter takaii ABI70S6]
MADLEFLEDFLAEITEILEQLNQDLVELESRPDDLDLLNRIFRAAHTMKGTSSFMGFEKMTTVTHRMEDILNVLRKGEAKLTPEVMDVVLEAVDVVEKIVENIRETQEEGDVDITEIVKKLEEAYAKLTGAKQEDEEESEEVIGGGKPPSREELEAFDREIQELLQKELEKEQQEQEDVVIGGGRPPTREELEAFDREIQELLKKELEKEQKEKAESASKTKTQQAKTEKKEKKGDTTIRVDVSRLDALMNLVGELVLGRNRLLRITQQLVSRYEDDALIDALVETMDQVDFITTDLQMAVMKTRMVPIARVFNRFPRVVRDLARELKKEVQLIIEGEDTELDRSIVEEIGDPLVHLVRNSIDHGIEPPEEREFLGKPRQGTIRLAAYHEGNHIVILVEDDGRGIDIEKIKEKALDKGLVTESDLARMSEKDILNLIFMPGFSTAEKVTDVSGRGVGMDVVKTNIEKLNGTIEINTQPGKGTQIIIKIPLTLAIIQSLLVQVGEEIYAIPLVSVVEAVKVLKSEIQKVEGHEIIVLRDSVLPLLELSKVFGIHTTENKDNIYVVVLSIGERRFGLVVDRLIGQEEIVIKSLGSYLNNVPGISGATIMGDGRVTLIIDVAGLANMTARVG